MSIPVEAQPAPAAGSRVLLTDGSTALIRRLDRGDRAAVDALHQSLPVDDRYLRFFSVSTVGPRMIADVIVADDETAVGAFRGDRLLGVAHFRHEPPGTDPEFAIAVAHADQHTGVGSLLLEHLAAAAVEEGVARLTAEVLAANHGMLHVLRDSGIPMSSIPQGDDISIVLHLDHLRIEPADTDGFTDAVLHRQALAGAASLRPVFQPCSLAVVGVGRRPDSVGG
jgi:GNAT superfamily N-acetyltransferase